MATSAPGMDSSRSKVKVKEGGSVPKVKEEMTEVTVNELKELNLRTSELSSDPVSSINVRKGE